ncbi:hypothetical protein LMG31506_06354 [Cupriavidus yeoncheonensis]|uniref:DUF4148 domain-containing protein n=1 Tax=Cupriavidus yeoncheonensis TaxID=1462994 RepID=A0A916J138_9BURK|nr:DUF4148 domain-containing protein [Cupriavidus yeoncheonensis]CAG2158413.1 hypothetical protein LMG31506_06354 [Cupriavidus yeoncheonensis]
MNTSFVKFLATISIAAFAAGGGIRLASAADARQSLAGSDSHPITRAELLHELQELKSVGYDPSDDNFPESLQKAQRKLDEKRRAESAMAVTQAHQPAETDLAR